MFSWEIENYLKENNYFTTHDKVREIMITSPQIDHFKLIELYPDKGYGKYQWWTNDNFSWEFYIKNEK